MTEDIDALVAKLRDRAAGWQIWIDDNEDMETRYSPKHMRYHQKLDAEAAAALSRMQNQRIDYLRDDKKTRDAVAKMERDLRTQLETAREEVARTREERHALIVEGRKWQTRAEAAEAEVARLAPFEDAVESTYKQWCGRNYEHLPLWEAVGAVIAENKKSADDEVARLTRERDLAIAHDTQPYPTAEAYEKICAAWNQDRAIAQLLHAQLEAAQTDAARYRFIGGTAFDAAIDAAIKAEEGK